MSAPEITPPEFSRSLRLDEIGGTGREDRIEATTDERAALARRFRIRAIDYLAADYRLEPIAGGWRATGTVHGKVVQACAATEQDVPENVAASFDIRFLSDLPDSESDDEGIELSDQDCDVVAIEGGHIDMGEAVAQTLALALTPYPRAANADAFLREMGVKQEGEEEKGPFGALSALLAKGKDA